MTPIIALFKKEARQHWTLAAAAVVICLLLQSVYYWLCWQNEMPIEFGFFFFQAIAITVFYAGVIAAGIYATEHANKTFIFLRKMPISTGMLAAGKIGWVLCGTGLVLIANLLLCGFWFLFLKDVANFEIPTFNSDDAIKACTWFALILTKVFVWGLFWTTLCRSHVNAATATGASVVGGTLGFIYMCFVLETEFSIVIPTDEFSCRLYHLAEIVLVGSLAVWGVCRWFRSETSESRFAGLLSQKVVLFRYPKQVQPPFLALVHHHIRHAAAGYHLGILSFVVFSLGMLFMFCYLSDDSARSEYANTWWWICGTIGSIFGIFVLWGSIFGHDLKNDSYLFLSRMGVHEGTFWWSRIVPALILYVPVLICVTIAYLVDQIVHQNNYSMERFWSDLESAPMGISVWFAIPAMGAFLSIWFRSQIVSVVLTALCMYALCLWMMFFMMTFGCSPLWTTLPICIAFLVASRIRARYWFKETLTWRSRFVPLAPVFATVLAILIAFPFVRIYSVPYVSWKQIDAYFDQADLGNNIRAPEKRKALIQHIAKHGTVPPEYEKYLEMIKIGSMDWELNAFSSITLEEYLLLNYAKQRYYWDRMFTREFWSEQKEQRNRLYMYDDYWQWLPYMPWEWTRSERVMRLRIVGELVESGGLQNKRTEAIQKLLKNQDARSRQYIFARDVQWLVGENTGSQVPCSRQMHVVFRAIDKWYADHDRTLPESLEELIEHGYLAEMPVHPFTGERMEYFRDAPPPSGIGRNDFTYGVLASGKFGDMSKEQRDRYLKHVNAMTNDAFLKFSDGMYTYLRLGKWVYLIIEPVEERSLELEDRSLELKSE